MAVLGFLKKHTVFCIAALAAAVTAILIPPDGEYLSYFDFNTLACLFMTLAVVCALRNVKFFTIVARKLVCMAGTLRLLALLLVLITFLGSMIIANDMALITFLPLGYFALSATGKEKHMAYVFVLQNISANLGGMLTPFGNPQNLYLYSYFHIPTNEFCLVMLPPFLLAVALLCLGCLLLPKESLSVLDSFSEPIQKKKTLLYFILFALSIAVVFRLVPALWGMIVITSVLLIVDRDALLAVDWPLLGTFFFFFIFAGNLSRVEAVQGIFSSLLSREPFLVSLFSCQVISNVPSAILLSRFTENWVPLLLGVNVGGTGTLIASLASLITFSEYRVLYPGHTKHFLGVFTAANLFFLLVMGIFCRFLLL